MTNWFVIYCKAQKDSVAEKGLTLRGFEVYRPLIKKTNKKNNELQIYTRSLFPRYLFLKVDLKTQAITTAKFTPGVAGFVRFGDKLSTVSEETIRQIRQCEEDAKTNKKEEFEKGNI